MRQRSKRSDVRRSRLLTTGAGLERAGNGHPLRLVEVTDPIACLSFKTGPFLVNTSVLACIIRGGVIRPVALVGTDTNRHEIGSQNAWRGCALYSGRQARSA